MSRMLLFLVAFLGGGAERWEWGTATPESQGLSSAKLDALRDALQKRQNRF